MSTYGYSVPPAGFPPPVSPGFPPGLPPKRRGLPTWAWVLVVLGGLLALSCAGVIGFVAYIGAVGPGTMVHTGNEVPKKFVDVARELGLIDPDEKVMFFYSDALTDVRNGMYIVTDRKVVIHIADAATPTSRVPFAMIEEADLVSSDSWLEDGTITLMLTDGSAVTFPASSEGGRDKLMFNAIEKGKESAGPE